LEENKPLSLTAFELFIENEQKYISYLIKENSQDCIDFDSKFFLNKKLKIILECLQDLILDDIKIDIDILFDKVKQATKEIQLSDIKLIVDSYSDFENIAIVKKRIKESYLKQVGTKGILENVLRQTTVSGDLDIDQLKTYNSNLLDIIVEIENDDDNLLTFEEIIDRDYEKTLDNRDKGLKKRTLGLRCLDKHIKYPGEPGDILTIVGRKGEGKTSIGINIFNALINLGIPVVYFCLDMGHTTVMDRVLCLRGRMSNVDLLQENRDESLNKKIDTELQKLKKIKNFLLYPQAAVSLKELDSYFLNARKKFIKRGALDKDDKYFVCIFDTIENVEEFSNAKSSYDIKSGINKLSYLLGKHGIFAINFNQLNENQIRAKKPKTLEDVEHIKFTKEDIEGGASFASKSRVVIISTKQKSMKLSFFPEEKELIDLEDDFILLTIDKQNDGEVGRIKPKLLFDHHTFTLYEYNK